MKASTHTEIYRPFTGGLLKRPMRWRTLAESALRLGFRRKLPALLLFTPVAIGCVIACFRVYFMFSLLSGDLGDIDSPQAMGMSMMITNTLGDVVENIFEYAQGMSMFTLLIMTWYGAGLIAEDRRMGANLLYFSRPLSRGEYLLGKFAGISAFGTIALLLPCLMVCNVAIFTSPDWSFLREQWDAIFKTLAFCAIWIGTIALIVLTISSLLTRKTHALIAVMGSIILSTGLSEVLAKLFNQKHFSLLNLFENFARLGEWMFDRWGHRREVTIDQTFLTLGCLWLACGLILTLRVRKLEVVA